MADVTVSAAGVVATATTTYSTGTSGAAVTAGQPVYADATASLQLKPCAAGTAAAAACVGIALNNTAGAGQPLRYATAGDLTLTGTTLAVGNVYVVSANAGGLAPSQDLNLTSGTNQATIIGVATSATNLRLAIQPSGVAKV